MHHFLDRGSIGWLEFRTLAVGDWNQCNLRIVIVGNAEQVGYFLLVHEMQRRNEEGAAIMYGLATLCAEGSQGSALIVESLSQLG